MASLYAQQDSNVRKTWMLMVLFLVFVLLVGWVFSEAYGTPSIFLVAMILAVGMNIAGYWYSDKIALSVSGARLASREEFFDLWTVTENLSIAAGLPMPRLYVIDDSALNAFATGRDPEHAAIAVTTGLLARLSRTELEGVIAHELAHVGNRDILLSTAIVVLVGFVSLMADFFLRTAHLSGDRERGNAGALFAVVGLVLALLSPVIATLIRLAVSRKREFLADATGALLTRYPEGLASALEKISSHEGGLRRAHHATAHLFIANPFSDHGGSRGRITKLFMTHPPVEERIRALREM